MAKKKILFACIGNCCCSQIGQPIEFFQRVRDNIEEKVRAFLISHA